MIREHFRASGSPLQKSACRICSPYLFCEHLAEDAEVCPDGNASEDRGSVMTGRTQRSYWRDTSSFTACRCKSTKRRLLVP